VIVSTEDNDRMYKAYRYVTPSVAPQVLTFTSSHREGVESQRDFAAWGMTPGNEQYKWHGTARECILGDPGQSELCGSTNCSMCGIIRHSYDIDKFGPKWGRLAQSITSDVYSPTEILLGLARAYTLVPLRPKQTTTRKTSSPVNGRHYYLILWWSGTQ